MSLAGPGNTQQAAQIGGQLSNVGLMLLSTQPSQVSHANTPVSILANSSIVTNQLLLVSSSGDITVGSGAKLGSNGSALINAQAVNLLSNSTLTGSQVLLGSSGDISLGSGASLISSGSTLLISQGGLSGGGNITLSGGTGLLLSLSGAINTGVNATVSAAGSITVINGAGGVNVGAGSKVTSGSITLISQGGVTVGGAGSASTLASEGGMLVLGSSFTATNATITSKQSTLFNSSNMITFNSVNLDGGTGSLLVSGGGMSLSSSQISAGGMFINGSSNIIDNGGSKLTATTSIFFSGKGMQFGSGSSIVSPSIMFNVGDGGVSLGGSSAALTVSGSSVSFNASSDITTDHLNFTSSSSLSLSTYAGTFTDKGSSSFTSTAGQLSISAKNITVGSGTTMTGKTGLSLNANSGAVTFNGASLVANSGTLSVQAQTVVTLNGDLKAGSLAAGPPATAAVVDVGSISITSSATSGPGGISIGSNRMITSAGGNITMTAPLGGIAFGSGNTIEADGGSISILSTGAITGSTGNTFNARAVGTAANSSGGLIEIAAGTTVSQMSSAITKASGTQPASNSLGTSVSINNAGGTTGVVQANLSNGGTVNLSPTTPAVLNLTGGAIVFDAAGKTIVLDGATFTVRAFKPVSHVIATANNSFSVHDPDQSSSHLQTRDVACVFVEGSGAPQMLTCRTSDSAPHATSIKFQRGEMFLHPLQALDIDCRFGKVRVKKGAFASVCQTESQLRVSAYTGPGDIEIIVTGRKTMSSKHDENNTRTIKLNPGEELILSDRELTEDERMREDGIGRRKFVSHSVATAMTDLSAIRVTLCDFSIASALGSVPHLKCLSNPTADLERALNKKLLKTACVLSVVTGNRGAYQARARIAPTRQIFKPVAYDPGH